MIIYHKVKKKEYELKYMLYSSIISIIEELRNELIYKLAELTHAENAKG